MAGAIKGITIEFNGDTTKLDKALRSIRKESKGVDSDLKAVNRALKFNPHNTELIAQKQTLLKQKISQTEKELKAFKSAEASLKAKGVKETSQEFMEVRRRIIEAESKVKNFNKQLQAINSAKLTSLGGKFKDAGNKATQAGKKLTTSVTLPIMGIGYAAGRATMDFDTQMSKVQAISGATGGQVDALRAKAQEMGRKTKFSATEAGQGLEYMAMAGWDAKSMIDGLPGVMNLAAASGEDLGTTSDIVTDALTAFGLEAKDAGHFADILAAASSNANTNVGLMGETFKYVAPIAGTMGYDAKDVALGIGLMANAGIKGSQAGTSLRAGLLRLGSPTEQTANAMKDLGIDIKDANGNIKPFDELLFDLRGSLGRLDKASQIDFANKLFGKNAASGWLAMLNASDDDVQKLSKALEDCDGSAEEMAATMLDNAGGSLTILKSTAEGAGIAIGETLAPLIKKGAEFAQKLLEKFNNLPKGAQQFIVIGGIIAAAIGPVLALLGFMLTGIGQLILAFTKIPMVMAGVSKAFGWLAANPWVLIITAIAAAALLIWKNWDKVKAKVLGIWMLLHMWAKAKWQAIKNAVVTPIKTAKDKVVSLFQNLKSGIASKADSIETKVSGVFQTIKSKITSPIQKAKDKVKEILDKLTSFFPIHIGKIFSGIEIPKFSLKGKFSAKKGTVPQVGYSWANIHAAGGIFTRPTLLQSRSGAFHEVGEAGAEAILPLGQLWAQMDRMADSIVNGVMMSQQIAGAGAGAPMQINLYAFPNGPQMGSWVVNTYDKYKKQLG